MNDSSVLSNMAAEMGAKVGRVEADPVTKEYLARAGARFEPIRSDDDATFLKTFAFDVDGMGPQVACPSNPANLKPVEDVAGTKNEEALLRSWPDHPREGIRTSARLLVRGNGAARDRC